jgi:hypothetical protein
MWPKNDNIQQWFFAGAILSAIFRVVSHLFTGSLDGIGKLPAFAAAGWYSVWYVRYFLYCKIWQELHFVKFCGNSPQKGGLVHQKGGRSKGKRGSHQMYNTEGPYRVFLWYWLGKYQENTSRYHTEIPNQDTILAILYKSFSKLCHFGRCVAWRDARI